MGIEPPHAFSLYRKPFLLSTCFKKVYNCDCKRKGTVLSCTFSLQLFSFRLCPVPFFRRRYRIACHFQCVIPQNGIGIQNGNHTIPVYIHPAQFHIRDISYCSCVHPGIKKENLLGIPHGNLSVSVRISRNLHNRCRCSGSRNHRRSSSSLRGRDLIRDRCSCIRCRRLCRTDRRRSGRGICCNICLLYTSPSPRD